MIEDETITGIKDLVAMIIERDKRIAELEADNRKLSEIEQRRISEAITQADSIAELREQLAALKKLARGFVEANTTIQYWHMKDEFRAALQERGK